MAIKQNFIPANLLSQIRVVDAAAGEAVKPTEYGDWIAVAGMRAVGVVRTFDPANEDPASPGNPLFYSSDDDNGWMLAATGDSASTPADRKPAAGETVSLDDPAWLIEGVTRTSLAWSIYDPAAPTVALASGTTATWALPDTTTGGGRRMVKAHATYAEPYSSRVLTVDIIREIHGVTGAPEFTVDISITGTGVVGTNGTIVPGTVTGSPTPTVSYQVYAGSAAQGSPQTSLTFPFSVANTQYTVVATATNSIDSDISTSNAIASTASSVPDPAAWNAAWWEWAELQVAPEGRLQVTIKGSPTLTAGYDYYVYTSTNEVASISDVRKNGALFTATGVITRPAKAKGTSVIPRIIAIRQGVADDAATGLFVLATTSPAYIIQGIAAATVSSVAASLPAPSAAVISDAEDRINGDKDRGDFGSTNGGSRGAYYKHCYAVLANAAYNGDADSITWCADQLAFYYTGSSNNWYARQTSTATKPQVWGDVSKTSCDPYFEFAYAAQYEIVQLAGIIMNLHTPAVMALVPDAYRKAMCAALEWVYVAGQYVAGTIASNGTGDNPRYNLRGRKGAMIAEAQEPNISAGNAYQYLAANMWMRSRMGKAWIVERGFTDLADFHATWTVSNLATFLSANNMRVGGVSTGKRFAQGLWETVTFASRGFTGPGSTSHRSSEAPSAATLQSILRRNASFRTAYTNHAIDDISGMALRYMARCFGKNLGDPIGTANGDIFGAERTGSNGTLGNPSSPNATANPPVWPNGPRVCHQGLRWNYGFAPGLQIGANVTCSDWKCAAPAGEDIPANTSVVGTNPDNKYGIPVYISGRGSTDAAKWGVSNGAVPPANRRGCPDTNTYPFPFLGETGIISEFDTADGGTSRMNNISSPNAPRSSSNYARETLSVFTTFMFIDSVIAQGPNNLCPNPQMGSGWSSGDANWTKIAAPAGQGWRSSSCYQHAYVSGQTGASGDLVSTATDAGMVEAGKKYMFTQQVRIASGSGNVTFKARWINSSGGTISDTTIFSGAITAGTTLDLELVALAPAGAVKAAIVMVVNRSTTTVNVVTGGPNIRWEPQPFIDWGSDAAKELAMRARRGLLWFRCALINGWRDVCKIGYMYAIDRNWGNTPGDQGTRSWSSHKDSHGYTSLFGFMINQVIPYWRTHIDGFPAYGAGYTDYDWECAVTYANNSGIVVK